MAQQGGIKTIALEPEPDNFQSVDRFKTMQQYVPVGVVLVWRTRKFSTC